MKKVKYEKITKDRVYGILVSISVDCMNPICAMSIREMSHHLKTSRYQVKKHINALKEEGMVELKMFDLNVDDGESEYMPPYWGYRLTKKGKDTPEFKEKRQEANKLFDECFGKFGDSIEAVE